MRETKKSSYQNFRSENVSFLYFQFKYFLFVIFVFFFLALAVCLFDLLFAQVEYKITNLHVEK